MKYRVHLVEVCEPYFMEEWYEDYETYAKAVNRVDAVELEYGKSNGDWYIRAKGKIEEINDETE